MADHFLFPQGINYRCCCVSCSMCYHTANVSQVHARSHCVSSPLHPTCKQNAIVTMNHLFMSWSPAFLGSSSLWFPQHFVAEQPVLPLPVLSLAFNIAALLHHSQSEVLAAEANQEPVTVSPVLKIAILKKNGNKTNDCSFQWWPLLKNAPVYAWTWSESGYVRLWPSYSFNAESGMYIFKGRWRSD